MSDQDKTNAQDKPAGKTDTEMTATQVFVAKRFFKDGSEVEDSEIEENEVIAVRRFVTEPAVVGISYGLTVNMGNYESARVDVTLRLPCYAEEVDDAFVSAREWVEQRVMTEVDGIKKKTGARVDF